MKGYDSIKSIKRLLYICIFIAFCLELIIFPTTENAFGALCLVFGWTVLSKSVIKRKYLERHFLCFLTILSYGICFFVLPMIITLVEGKPLTFRFSVPYTTFINLLLNLFVIISAFIACTHIYKEGLLTNLWKKLGYFRPPTEKQIWAMGFIGLLALIYNVSIQGSDLMDASNKGIVGQAVGALTSLCLAPFCLFFRNTIMQVIL